MSYNTYIALFLKNEGQQRKIAMKKIVKVKH